LLFDTFTIASRTTTPMTATMKPTMMRVRWACRFANRSWPSDDNSTPAVAAEKIAPLWIAS
jgi:hypothetical protein